MDKNDPVREYYRRRGYASYAIEGGLERLVDGWESSVAELRRGVRLYFIEYRNDLDRRQIIDESRAVASLDQWHAIESRVQAADAAFIQETIPFHAGLYPPDAAQAKGWTPTANWWYYRIPKTYEFRGETNEFRAARDGGKGDIQHSPAGEC